MAFKPVMLVSDDGQTVKVSKTDAAKLLAAKAKKDSVDKRFMEFMKPYDLRHHEGFAARWVGSHWEPLRGQPSGILDADSLDTVASKETDLNRIALKWLLEESPSDYAADKAEKIVRTLLLSLPKGPKAPEHAVIACKNAWLQITAKTPGADGDPSSGILSITKPNKDLGVYHALDLELPFAEGQTIYEPRALPHDCLLRRFLDGSQPNMAVRDSLQEWLGYILASGLPSLQVHPLFIGGGRNGKGVIQEIVSGMFNPTQVAAINIENGLKGFGLSSLLGASLIQVDEMPKRLNDTSILKALLGEGIVQVDRKNRDPVALRSNARWMFSSNHPLKSNDGSAGFWARFFVIPFEHEIPAEQRIPGLSKLLLTHEKLIILEWMLEGLTRFMRRGGKMVELPQSRSAREDARLNSNSFLLWVADAEPRVSKSKDRAKTEVYDAYAAWAKSSGVSPFSAPEFWKQCKSEFPDLLMFRRRCGGGKQEWFSNFVFESDDPTPLEPLKPPAFTRGSGEDAALARSQDYFEIHEHHPSATPFDAYNVEWDAFNQHWESLALKRIEKGCSAEEVGYHVATELAEQGAALNPDLAAKRIALIETLMKRSR